MYLFECSENIIGIKVSRVEQFWQLSAFIKHLSVRPSVLLSVRTYYIINISYLVRIGLCVLKAVYIGKYACLL